MGKAEFDAIAAAAGEAPPAPDFASLAPTTVFAPTKAAFGLAGRASVVSAWSPK